jgi:phosphoserine phosphatase RsbU/P
MTSVAGGFYDFLVADDKRADILIADVSGHGLAAALIAFMVKLAAAAAQIANASNPSDRLSAMNATLLSNIQRHFVTAAYVYVYLDAETGELNIPPPLIQRCWFFGATK